MLATYSISVDTQGDGASKMKEGNWCISKTDFNRAILNYIECTFLTILFYFALGFNFLTLYKCLALLKAFIVYFV
jgi:hypothetical protein